MAFALPSPRQSNYDLPGADYLPWLGERLHHNTVGIREQHGIARRITGHVSLGLRGAQLRLRGIGCGFDLVVARGGNGTGGNQVAIASLVIRGLFGSGFGGSDSFLLRSCLQPQVNGVETHERLTTLNGLTGIDQTLKHLARHSETQVTLDASRHDAGE